MIVISRASLIAMFIKDIWEIGGYSPWFTQEFIIRVWIRGL